LTELQIPRASLLRATKNAKAIAAMLVPGRLASVCQRMQIRTHLIAIAEVADGGSGTFRHQLILFYCTFDGIELVDRMVVRGYARFV
jgi:hypothetical protein